MSICLTLYTGPKLQSHLSLSFVLECVIVRRNDFQTIRVMS